MATVTQSPIKAKYATVYDAPARIAKVNGALYVIYDDGRIEPFEVEMAPFTVVLGDVQTADLQAMWDAWAAGDRKAAVAAIPEHVVDDLIVHGSAAEIREHVARYTANGVTTPSLAIISADPATTRQALVALGPNSSG